MGLKVSRFRGVGVSHVTVSLLPKPETLDTGAVVQLRGPEPS